VRSLVNDFDEELGCEIGGKRVLVQHVACFIETKTGNK
jgi:hypothetical protein